MQVCEGGMKLEDTDMDVTTLRIAIGSLTRDLWGRRDDNASDVRLDVL